MNPGDVIFVAIGILACREGGEVDRRHATGTARDLRQLGTSTAAPRGSHHAFQTVVTRARRHENR